MQSEHFLKKLLVPKCNVMRRVSKHVADFIDQQEVATRYRADDAKGIRDADFDREAKKRAVKKGTVFVWS